MLARGLMPILNVSDTVATALSPILLTGTRGGNKLIPHR